MNQLITINDLRSIRAIKYEEEGDIDNKILEAQELDLKDMLGVEFYYQVLTTPGNYTDFLEGCDYTYNRSTINWAGLKKMLCYYALARVYSNKNLVDTESGLMKKINEFSEGASRLETAELAGEMRSIGEHYQTECTRFLCEQTEEKYSKWCGRERHTGGSFSIRAAGGNRDRQYRDERPHDKYDEYRD